MSDDDAYMRRALELAERGWGRTWPNPLVGAVIVRDGEVVGEGWHAEFGGPHAEVVALDQAGEKARGATAYVSLEPCAHHGKTPPCADALIDAGVARVVYATGDPGPTAGGGGARLRDAGVEVTAGVEEDAARALNAPFFHALVHGRPWVALKYALSLDARLAVEPGAPTAVTGEAARTEVHRMRAGYDAVLVGVGTALADDPLLTVRGGVVPRVPPVRVVADAGARLPLSSRLVTTLDQAPVWVLCAEDADPARRARLEEAGVRVVASPAGRGGLDIEGVLATLWSAGVRAVLIEGGGILGASFLEADRIEELDLFYAPVFFGEGGVPAFPGVSPGAGWRLHRTTPFGDDVLVSLRRHRVDAAEA